MKRFLSLFLALVVAVGICLSAPMTIEAEAYSVSRDDGVWLFPLTSYYYYNNFTDFAGCVGYANSACPFCGYAHPEYADPPNGHQWQANFGGHNGIDIGAATGTAVFAPASGVVIGSGTPSNGHETRGITVMLKHDLGNGWAYYSYSQHLNKSYVSVGQTVAVGTTIGEVGNTGVGTGAHLHFGIVMAPSNYSFYQVLNVDCVGSTADNNWLTTSGYKTGKLVTNPKNGGTNMASVNAHRGSVTYTFDKNAVSINAATPTTGITLNATAKTLKIGDSLTLTATVTPSNATNKTVTWSSTNTNIATVSNGVVKAVANGVVDITAKASGGQTAVCKVVVAPETLTPAARTVIGNNVYEFYKDEYIGNDASTYAKNRGGYLVTLTSEEERNLVYNWVKSLAPSAVAISMGAYRTGETTFAWESGEAWGYAPWVSGEPNNTNGRENRAIMVMSSGNWNDITGDYSWPFVIEYSLDTYKSKGYDIEGIPVLKLPENPDMSNYKESTLYRYADKQFTTSANETLDGWTKYDSQTSYGDWGAVKTTLSKPTEGANLRITGTKTLYKYYHYWNYYDGMHCLDSIKYGTNKGYCEIYLTYQLSPVVFQDQGGRQGYGSYTCDKDKFNYWFFDKAYTQYSYQERTVTGTNYFYKWGDWSDWSTTPVTANDNRKVETKTSYTLTAHTHSASDWVTTKDPTCTVEGTKVIKCTGCGEVMQTESIPVVAHIKSDWIVDKEATVKEAGSKHIECTVCKKVLETASIERLPLLAPTVKATNVANGINVNWNSVDGAEKYIVYRKTYNDSTKAWGGWETLTSNCTATSYVDTKAMIGVKYIYTAVAVAGDVKSSFVATSALLRDVAPTVKVANATSGVTVTWNSVYGAQKYTVYRKTYNDTTKAWSSWETLTSNCTTTSYTDSKALLGVKYMYTVRAVRNGVGSSFVASGTLQRDVAPTVKISNKANGINVTWNSVYGAQKYTVYRKVYNATTKTWGSWETVVSNCTATSYTDTKALVCEKYKYTVAAVRGNFNSTFVETTLIQRDIAPTVKVANATSGVTVTWNSVYGAQKYTVYRKTYNDTTKAWGSWEVLTNNCTATTYTDTKALLGVKYIYTVVAVRNGVNSSFVATKEIQRNVTPTVKIANATNGVTVTWNSVYGAQKYIVYRKTYNDTTKAWSGWEALTNNCTATTYTDTKALLGVKYIYTVVAVRNGVNSSFVATGELQRDVAPAVTIAKQSNGIKVNWSSVYGAQKYTVYRKTYNATTKTWSSWQAVKTGCTGTSYTDTTVKNGTYYRYTVCGVRNGFQGSFVQSSVLQYVK